MSSTLTAFPLGQGLAVLQNDNERLHILNPLARWIWESLAAGMEIERLKTLLVQETGQGGQTVDDLVAMWGQAGLVPSHPEGKKDDRHYDRGSYWLGDCRVCIQSNDDGLLRQVHACMGHLEDPGAGLYAATFTLCREGNRYTLHRDESLLDSFSSADDCLVRVIWEVIETGCRLPDCLLVIHGGAVFADGFCCILAGAGGSGKTTLVAGLVASGYTLVADDVLPVVARSGLLESVAMSMCIKEGSWDALKGLYPNADTCPVYQRNGRAVRFYPPPSAALPEHARRYRADAVLFPRYTPGGQPRIIPMAPYEVLAELVQTNSRLRIWTPEKIAQVVSWVSGLKGFALTYPDLSAGMDLVGQIRENCTGGVMTEDGCAAWPVQREGNPGKRRS